MTRIAGFAVVGALALGAAGCQEAAHEPPRTQDSAPKPAVAPVVDGVTVVGAGREPRRALRYHLGKGGSVPIEISLDVDIQLGALAAGGAAPTMVLAGAISVDDVTADGDAHVRFRIDHAAVRARPGAKLGADAFAAQAKQLEGFVETATLSPTGHLRDVHAAAAASSPAVKAAIDSLADQLAQIAVVVPTAAVGVGASWTTTRAIETSGIHMSSTTTTSITAIDGDRVTYSAATQVSGADQHASVGGNDLALHGIVGTGGGQGTVDLATLAVSGTFTTAFHLEVTADQVATQMGMTMTTTVSRPAPAP